MKFPVLRKARRESHDLVKQTGNAYAYQYVRVGPWLVEVRALADGRTTYTSVDTSGRAIGRAYGFKRVSPSLAVSLAVAIGFILELVL